MDAAASGRAARWLFVWLSFAITFVGYADRQVLALLKPVLDARFGWTAGDYALMSTVFQVAIAFSLLGAGWFLDRVGLRLGLAIGLAGWSAAACAHAAARTVGQFVAARAALGIGESVATPAGMKAVASFFAPETRGVVIGLLNTAPNIATIVTPFAVGALYVSVGWQGTVAALGATGFFCAGAWLLLPFRRMAAAPGGEAAGGAVWREGAAWALAAAKFLTDQAWWFFLFWLPDDFHRRFGLDIRQLMVPVATVYGAAALGSVLGGIAPRLLAARGMPMGAARRVVLWAAAFAVLPIVLEAFSPGLWGSVALVGLALLGHQAFAVNVFALAAARFPAARIGRVTGMAAFAGNMGGALSVHLAGWCVRALGQLTPMFFVAAGGYLLAAMVLRGVGETGEG